MLFKFRKSVVNILVAGFIYLLGLYQFSEFMMCSLSSYNIWPRFGFIIYTLLPLLSLYISLILSKTKFNKLVFVLPTLIFSLIALFYPYFIVSASCHTIFVQVQTLFFKPESLVLPIIYWLYYIGYIAIASLLVWAAFLKSKDWKKKRIFLLGEFAILAIHVPTLIFLMMFPTLGIMFPSVYCEFALLLSLVLMIMAYLDDKYKVKY